MPNTSVLLYNIMIANSSEQLAHQQYIATSITLLIGIFLEKQHPVWL